MAREHSRTKAQGGKRERVQISLNVDARTKLGIDLLAAALDLDRGTVLDTAVGLLVRQKEAQIRDLPDEVLTTRNRAA